VSGERVFVRLGNVAALLRGVSYEKQASSEAAALGLVPLLRATNISGEIDFGGLLYVPASCVSESQDLRSGDSVIAASSGSLAVVGKSATLRSEWNGTFGAFCYALRPDSDFIAPLYLGYFLQTSSYRAQVSRLAAGVNINNLKRQHLENLQLPLCPRHEQHRIIEALESYFTRLAAAVATLKCAQQNLKRYQASVLKAAVEGRLVPTEVELARAEGRSYEPGSVLLKRILAERRRRWEEAEFAKMAAKRKAPKDDRWKEKYVEPLAPATSELPALPEGWCWATVDQLERGDRRSAYGVLVPGPDVPTGVPFVRVGDIRGGRIDGLHMKRIARHIADKFAKTYLQGGEVLLTLVGTIGRTAVVPPTLAGANVARAVGVIPTSDLVDPHWIEYWFRSPLTRHRIASKAHEVARKTLNLEDVRAAFVAVPPLCEQRRIREALDDYGSIRNAVAEATEASVKRCERLRQSILKWAFEGRLVDQDPSDESASVLLFRLRAERTVVRTMPAAIPLDAKSPERQLRKARTKRR
jgi:type I restriction enzyme, S subunit